MNPRPKILLIEDDTGIAAALKKDLQTEGSTRWRWAARGDEKETPGLRANPGTSSSLI